MSTKKCLACWEEIEDTEKICHHCGSDQEDVKDFLALAVLKQQNQKITVPEKTPVLDFIFKVDPDAKEEVTFSSTPNIPDTKPSSSYQAKRPSWLGIPSTTKAVSSQEVAIQDTKSKDSSTDKIVVCPHCLEEVPFKKYCKFCGKPLQKECTKCKKQVSIAAKFCTHCGYIIESSDDKKQKNQSQEKDS